MVKTFTFGCLQKLLMKNIRKEFFCFFMVFVQKCVGNIQKPKEQAQILSEV
ncbi:hypothetical protein J2S13_001006 [Oikeobacillus pervagus]|uniref:Uncharacterized protein n=1 Tax=Oikeobacillus pervagus TaxID=1325931 RepID=A0AAJ1T4E7_9BACI|nr:hypothetical protein [Oikeobacillus pervagus]